MVTVSLSVLFGFGLMCRKQPTHPRPAGCCPGIGGSVECSGFSVAVCQCFVVCCFIVCGLIAATLLQAASRVAPQADMTLQVHTSTRRSPLEVSQ